MRACIRRRRGKPARPLRARICPARARRSRDALTAPACARSGAGWHCMYAMTSMYALPRAMLHLHDSWTGCCMKGAEVAVACACAIARTRHDLRAAPSLRRRPCLKPLSGACWHVCMCGACIANSDSAETGRMRKYDCVTNLNISILYPGKRNCEVRVILLPA